MMLFEGEKMLYISSIFDVLVGSRNKMILPRKLYTIHEMHHKINYPKEKVDHKSIN